MNTWIFQVSAWGESWLSALGRASVEGGLTLFTVWLVSRGFPRVPAWCKCWLWRLAYLKLLVTFWGVPLINLPVLPAAPATTRAFSTEVPTMTRQSIGMPVTAGNERLQDFTPKSRIQIVPNTAGCLFIIWGLTAGWLGWRIVRDWRNAQAIRRSCKCVTDERWRQSVRTIGQRFGLHRIPNIMTADCVSTPLLLGTTQPVIVLPASAVNTMSLDHLEMALAHELAHLKRLDPWWIWLAAVGETLFFFHPALWLARREWRLTQEMACDELAIRRTRLPAAQYGDMLVRIASQMRHQPSESTVLAFEVNENGKTLMRRLKAMKIIEINPSKWISASVVTVLVAGGINVLPWRLVGQETQTPVQARPEPKQEPSSEPKEAPAQVAFELIGTVVPLQVVQVAPKVAGQVTKLHAEIGAVVKTGDLLAELDPTQYELELRKLQAKVDLAKTRYQAAKPAPGEAPGFSSKNLTVAEAEIELAQVELQSGDYALASTRIRSPIDGTILTRQADIGTVVDPKAATGRSVSLYEIADLRKLAAVVEVTEPTRAHVQLKQPCRIFHEGSKSAYSGEVLRIQPAADPSTGTFRTWVRLKLPEKGAALWPGSFVRVEFLQPEGNRRMASPSLPSDDRVSKSQLKVFPLQYADSEKTAEALNKLYGNDIPKAASGAARNLITAQDNTKQKGKVIAVSDSRTHSVVVSASSELMDEIEKVMARLDTKPVEKR